MKHWYIAALILLSIVITACNTTSVATMTVIPTAIDKSVPIASPEPTNAPKLVSTSTPTNETAPTILPATLSVVSTIEAIVTEKPELQGFYERSCIISGSCCCLANFGLSPNGKWAVFFIVKDGTGGLSVINVDSKKQLDISYFDIMGVSGGDATVEIEHWSHDGKYLYVSPRTAGSGGLGWFWRSETELVQLDLTNGDWVNTNMGSAFSFSPDDRFIAYRQEQNVVIHDFQTGQEQSFTVPLEYGAFGRFVWSLDGKQIIFIGSSVDELQSDELSDKANGFTLFLLNTGNMKVRTIIKNDERYLYPLEWQAPNLILLESLYQVASDGTLQYNGNEKYQLDLATNAISSYESP